jgi:hypothetical protein
MVCENYEIFDLYRRERLKCLEVLWLKERKKGEKVFYMHKTTKRLKAKWSQKVF